VLAETGQMPASDMTYDAVFVGGGLASCLSALRLHVARPEARIAIYEAGPEICGNHTWSFHGPDVSAAAHRWLAPMVAHRWDSQQVIFPKYRRTLDTPYMCLTSESLRTAVHAAEGIDIHQGQPVAALAEDGLTTASGESVRAACVFDGRGFAPSEASQIGFQKFLGLEVELATPHGLEAPVIMDATVTQRDGYCFIYLLPFSPTRLLIEETYYSDGHDLSVEVLEGNMRRYAEGRGWEIRTVVRREQGILPIALTLDAKALWCDLPKAGVPIGLRAHLFHPVTGYSLPTAVETAERVATHEGPLTTAALREVLHEQVISTGRRNVFLRMLNRMLFRAAEPEERYLVLQRFYGLREGLIERFYAGRPTLADKARILAGKPPVPIGKAMGCIRE